jgi:hypothetical protein
MVDLSEAVFSGLLAGLRWPCGSFLDQRAKCTAVHQMHHCTASLHCTASDATTSSQIKTDQPHIESLPGPSYSVGHSVGYCRGGSQHVQQEHVNLLSNP